EAALREELASRGQHSSQDSYEAPWHAERGRSPPRDRRSPLRHEEQSPHAATPTAARKKRKPKKKRAGTGGAAGGAVGGSQVGHPPMAPPRGQAFDGRADTQLAVSAPPEKSPTSNICFNCGEMGHFRSDCTAPEQCLFCGDPAHLAAACKERFNSRRRREVIEYLGHGIDGGFYYIDLGGGELSTPQHLAVITVLPEQDPPLQIEVTVDTIRAELAQLESTWVWNLACTLPHVFFGKGGRALTVEVEGDEAQAGSQTPPLDPSQSHHDEDAEDDDDSSDGGSEDDLGGDGEDSPQRQVPDAGSGPSAALDTRPGAQSALPGSARAHRSAPAKLGASTPRAPPAVTVESCDLSILEYGSNFPQEASSASVGLDVCPPQSPRSPGLVCYTRSPGSTPTSPLGPATPGPTVLEPASVFPDTPMDGAKARAPRRHRQSTQSSRHSARLARSRSGAEAMEPTVAGQAERRVATRNLDSGTHPTPRPSPSVTPGERGPRSEQLAAIRAKEVYDGVLAASRAQLERERATTATLTDPVQLAPGSGLEPFDSPDAVP
ncbi:hypothetical protein QYE76_057263, partial [Lolium multiflorum]